jgi:hypothetical protein
MGSHNLKMDAKSFSIATAVALLFITGGVGAKRQRKHQSRSSPVLWHQQLQGAELLCDGEKRLRRAKRLQGPGLA